MNTRASLVSLVAASLLLHPTWAAISVAVDKDCYKTNEPVAITFDNTDTSRPPESSDWVAVYPWPTDVNSLAEGSMWLFLCVSQRLCSSVTSQATITFGPNGTDESEADTWPLDPGTYVAVLAGGLDPPFSARATSQVFTVQPEGGSCLPANMTAVIQLAREDIAAVIAGNKILGPKFVRLAFHDCVGGCDGCVDFTNPDNAGLGLPISALQPIVSNYTTRGLSRADVWMLAATVAADVLQPAGNNTIDFPFDWIGRKTCDVLYNNTCGTGFDGQVSACTTFGGPHRELCHGDAGTTTMMEFFQSQFNFDAQKVAAIMGAHSIGSMRRQTIGFDGPTGWDLTSDRLDNGYYAELVPKPSEVDDSTLPDWKVVMVDNSDLTDVPSRPQWEANEGDIKLVMLNVDMAMARQVVDGTESCAFKGNGTDRCPDNSDTVSHMRRYAGSRQVFLEDFREALELLTQNGYAKTGNCTAGEVCQLQVTAFQETFNASSPN